MSRPLQPDLLRSTPGDQVRGRARARTWKWARRLGAGLWLSIASCGGDDAAADGLDAAEAADRFAEEIAEPTGADRADRRLVIAVRRVPETLDPLGDLEPWGARVAEDLVFEGLTRRVSTGAPWAEPALADACVGRPSAAPRDVYCHLRDDAVFHDGEPVTPEDALYSLSWWLDPRRVTMRLRAGLGGLRRVELVDGPPGGPPPGSSRDPGRWVHVSFSRQEPLALEMLADMYVVPRSRHRGRARAFGRAPVGTGPFHVTALEPDRLVLEPWAPEGGPAPSLPEGAPVRIVLREMPDGAEALTAMRRGEVHMTAELSPAHVPEELTRPGTAPRFRAYVLTPSRFDVLLYNLRRGVQSGPQMRGVLDDAIPRAALADALGDLPPLEVDAPVDLNDPHEIDLGALFEAGVSARLGMAGLPAPLDPSRDDARRERAVATLDSLDWVLERGVRRRATGALRITLMWSGDAGEGRTIAHGIRDAWREVGIIAPFATAGWAYLLTLMRKGEFDVTLVRLAERTDADLYPYFHSRGDLNIAGVTDVALDEALEAYRAAANPSARDEAKRAVAARLAALRVGSVIRAPTQVMMVSKRVQGLEFADDLPRLDRLRLAPIETWILGQRAPSVQ